MLLAHGAEHGAQCAAMRAIADKIGCTPETLRGWVRQKHRDHGNRSAQTASERDRVRDSEREGRESKQANEILRRSHATFDPRLH